MIQSYSFEEMDRTIYELLRVRLVAMGYLPDITSYSNSEDYMSAKETIRQSGKDVIEVFGVGTTWARDEKTVCEVLIDRKEIKSGDLGGGTYQYIENNDGTFRKEKVSEQSMDFDYEITAISNSVKYSRIMGQIVYDVLGIKRYHQIVSDYNQYEDKGFFMSHTNETDVSSTDLRERLFRYTAEDIWINPSETVLDNIEPLTSVKFITTLKTGDDTEFVIGN